MTTPSDTPSSLDVVEQLQALERQRGNAIVANDLATLRTLLSPRLVHVHARGNVDTLQSYLDFLTGKLQVLKVQRGDLAIEVHGHCAVMVGRQTNTSRLLDMPADAAPMVIESMVTQVWVLEDGRWQQVAFQATPLGAPPAAITPRH